MNAVINAYAHHDYKKALDYLTTIIEKEPNNVNAHYYLGCILSKLGDELAAMNEYKICIQLSPESQAAKYAETALGTGNRISNSIILGAGRDGVNIVNGHNTTVSGSTINNSNGNGITIHGGSNNRIIGNDIGGSGGVGQSSSKTLQYDDKPSPFIKQMIQARQESEVYARQRSHASQEGINARQKMIDAEQKMIDSRQQ